jgi:hypothetical protein
MSDKFVYLTSAQATTGVSFRGALLVGEMPLVLVRLAKNRSPDKTGHGAFTSGLAGIYSYHTMTKSRGLAMMPDGITWYTREPSNAPLTVDCRRSEAIA